MRTAVALARLADRALMGNSDLFDVMLSASEASAPLDTGEALGDVVAAMGAGSRVRLRRMRFARGPFAPLRVTDTGIG